MHALPCKSSLKSAFVKWFPKESWIAIYSVKNVTDNELEDFFCSMYYEFVFNPFIDHHNPPKDNETVNVPISTVLGNKLANSPLNHGLDTWTPQVCNVTCIKSVWNVLTSPFTKVQIMFSFNDVFWKTNYERNGKHIFKMFIYLLNHLSHKWVHTRSSQVGKGGYVWVDLKHFLVIKIILLFVWKKLISVFVWPLTFNFDL